MNRKGEKYAPVVFVDQYIVYFSKIQLRFKFFRCIVRTREAHKIQCECVRHRTHRTHSDYWPMQLLTLCQSAIHCLSEECVFLVFTCLWHRKLEIQTKKIYGRRHAHTKTITYFILSRSMPYVSLTRYDKIKLYSTTEGKNIQF